MDLVRTALEHADGGRAAGDDRYMVHLVSRDGGRSLSHLDGTPLHPGDAAMITCDTSTVTHTVSDEGEPLHLGRKTRDWSTAQRRAITVRDGGQCRFVGCHFTALRHPPPATLGERRQHRHRQRLQRLPPPPPPAQHRRRHCDG